MLTRIFACAVLMMLSLPLAAQTWPSKPIRLVVTFSPGGTSDIVARLIQPQLQERLGQPVVVENRPGAGATIGASAVAQADPDGYTLLLNNTAPMSLSPVMMDKPPYDPLKSFTHIAYIGAVPNVMVVHPSVPAKNLTEFVAFAKSQPGGINYSGAGAAGTIGHVVGELFKNQAGINLVYIGYKGSAPMQQDLLAGRLLFAIDGLPQNVGHIREGRLRALAVTSTQREKLAPDVPSVVEAGYPSLVAENFVGISGPAKLAPAIVERVHKAVVDSVAVPAVQTRLGELGFTTRAMSSSEFTAFIEKQVTSWAEPVRASGAKLQ